MAKVRPVQTAWEFFPSLGALLLYRMFRVGRSKMAAIARWQHCRRNWQRQIWLWEGVGGGRGSLPLPSKHPGKTKAVIVVGTFLATSFHTRTCARGEELFKKTCNLHMNTHLQLAIEPACSNSQLQYPLLQMRTYTLAVSVFLARKHICR